MRAIYGIVRRIKGAHRMRALRSALVNRVLADPESRAQLHSAVVKLVSGDVPTTDQRVTVRSNGRTTVYQPVIVPYPHPPSRA
jgi:hypothetical protein